MKILYTTHQFYPDYGAGTELLTYLTAYHMRERGHNVRIATGFPLKSQKQSDAPFDSYCYDGIRIHRYRHSSFHPVEGQCIMAAESRNLLVKQWFRQIIEVYKPDVVHAYHLQRLSASILEICNEMKIPFIITVTDFWMICPTTQLFLPGNRLCEGPQRMMENCVKHLAFKSTNSSLAKKISLIPDSAIRLMQHTLLLYPKLQVGHLADLAALTKRTRYIVEQVNRAKRVIVSNGFMHTILQKHGVAAAIIRKIPFGISPFETVDACPQSDNSALRVGFIGTLNFHKGAHILIKAVRELSNSRRIQVSIYGNRDQFPNYVLMLDEIVGNDARIDFKGTFPSDQIGRVLGSLDLLVVPSLWYENTPLVIHQAHAARVPVIASNLGGMNEVVRDRQNGFLIQPGNTGQLSAILESLIDNRSVLEKIRSKIEPPLMIDRYADLIEEQYHAAVNCEVRDNS